MSRSYREFDEARIVRLETLEIVEGLGQEQSEFQPAPDKWSAGEVLDHLVKLDTAIVRELDVTLNQRKRGIPFVYRGIADFDTTIPWLLRPVLPFFEVPFSLFNVLVPQTLRRSLSANRSVPLQAPGVIRPRFGRPIDTLREELGKTYDLLEEQQSENPDVDLNRVYYYNVIAGLNSVPGMYKFISNHEKRHQNQLRDVLAAFPQAA